MKYIVDTHAFLLFWLVKISSLMLILFKGYGIEINKPKDSASKILQAYRSSCIRLTVRYPGAKIIYFIDRLLPC